MQLICSIHVFRSFNNTPLQFQDSFYRRTPGRLYPCFGHFLKSYPNKSPNVFEFQPPKVFWRSHPHFSKVMSIHIPTRMTTTWTSTVMIRTTIAPCSRTCRTWTTICIKYSFQIFMYILESSSVILKIYAY